METHTRMLTTPTPRIEGSIERLHADGCTGTIMGDDGRRYFMAWKNFARYGPHTAIPFRQLRVTMRVEFVPVESDRARDDPRALEIKVTDIEMDGI
jgi:hypothetical protein